MKYSYSVLSTEASRCSTRWLLMLPMDEVKAKLDSVHKLLKKQVSFVEDAEAVEGRTEEEESRKRIAETDRPSSSTMTRASSPDEHDRVAGRLAGYLGRDTSQLARRARPCRRSTRRRARPRHEPARPASTTRMTVDFNGKIDSVYNNLNTKFETLSSHVKKMEIQVVQTGDAIRRQEASARGVGDNVMKNHMNSIIEDDFWQVVKEEKLQEGDFEVESLMSFGGSHWCRSKPTTEHRSTYTNQNRSTTPTESTASCNAVKILAHEDFAAKNPHPPSPTMSESIDMPTATSIDTQNLISINNHHLLSIDEPISPTECKCRR
uniref:Uncharacterized protein n=1 Tax=Brassica oleracea var. oleracea TaxID=109376 RepID=A0A0D3D4A2_BRAOL